MATIGQQLTSPESGWQRIDDNNSRLGYAGSWSRRGDGASYATYGSTWIESYTAGNKITFKVRTTRLRVMAYGNNDTSGFEVIIDGTSRGKFKSAYGIGRCVLCCDIQGLTANTDHTVELIVLATSAIGGNTTRFLFDCIDIDSDGYVYAGPGAILTNPEPGWQRIDNADPNFSLIGSWAKSADGAPYGAYQNTWSWSQTAGDQIAFILKSTRFRIYAYGQIDTSGFDLYIDGVLDRRYCTIYNISKVVMVCDISGLDSGEHVIQIVLKDKSLFSSSSSTLTRILFDCIDIDPDGYIASIGFTPKTLTSPETGWSRYDGSNTDVQCINLKQVETGDTVNYMSGNVHVINDPSKSAMVRIKTTGNKIRLIAPLQRLNNRNVLVYLNGTLIDSYSAPNVNILGQMLYYETPDFSHPTERFASIDFVYLNADSNPFFDCFDIYGGVLVQNPAETINANTGISFEYTSQAASMLEIEIPGVYAIECWGANGGGNSSRSQGSSGGWGGYSYGEKYFNQGDIIYCVPGGQGVYSTGYFNGGGFNGGGNGGSVGHGGGGGTDVRFGTNDLAHRIIVAGGGGGADDAGSGSGSRGGGNDGSGGNGGGLASEGAWVNGVYYVGYGATQNSGYQLGVGQSAYATTDTGGAGGGYWGGRVSNDNNGGAGGGSSYIGDLDNAYTVGGVWWGNGKIKITLLQEDPRFNFQHYAIKCFDKFYIPNATYFDTVSKRFVALSINDLIDFNQNPSMYITDVHDLFKPFTKNGKQYFPMNYIRTDLDLKIYKFIGHSDSVPMMKNNHMRRKLTLATDFTKLLKTTLIKMKNITKLTMDTMINNIVVNNSTTVRIGLECNSTILGKGFITITEDEIRDKGFEPSDLTNLEIPFDNVRYVFDFVSNNVSSSDEIKNVNIIKRSRNLQRIMNHNDYAVLVKKDNDNIYIQMINGAISNITVNKITKDTSYRVINALETF